MVTLSCFEKPSVPSRERAVGISFLKAAILTLSGVVERPLARIQGRCTGKEGYRCSGGSLMALPASGRPGMNFKAKLPFYGMM